VAVELATAYVSLVPSARGISAAVSRELQGPTTRAAADAGSKAGKAFGGRFSSGLKVFAGAVGGAFAVRTIARFGTALVGAAEESMKVTRDTAAVIKSMGNVAGISAEGVARLSTELSRKTGVDDELIQSGSNLLLTFGNIRNEVGKGNDIFNQATQVSVDLAARFKTDIPSAAKTVGKALNDPINGLTALGRVGVQFTDQQKEQIKALVESGDTMGAQKIIMAELTRQTAGSAIAQATATDKLKVAFGNVAEQIGGVLLPYVNQFADWMLREGIPLIETRLVPAIATLADWIAKELAPAIRDEWLPAAQDIGRILKDTVLPVLDRLGDGFLDSSGTVQTALVGMGASVKLFGVQTAATVVKVAARWAWMAVQALFHAAKVALAWLISLGPIGLVIAAVAGAAALIIANWDKIQRFVTTAAKAVVDFLRRNWPLIVAILTGPIGIAVLAIIRHWDKIRGIFNAGIEFVKRIWTAGWTAVRNFVVNTAAAIVRTITGWKNTIIGIFANAVSWLLEGGRNILRGLWNGIREIWNRNVAFWTGMAGTVKGYFAKARTWLVEGGKNIISGMWTGIKAIWSNVVKWFKDLPGRILGVLGISSPPRWAIDAGRFILEGIVKGLGLGVGNVLDFMAGLAGKFTGALADAWGGIQVAADVVPVLRGGGNQTNRAMGQQMARDLYGWTGAQWNALNALVMSESGWSNTAQNPTSTAYGIGQFLNSTWAGTGYSKTSDPATQIRAMLRYIAQRYGDPASAWAFKRSHNYYEAGAWRTGDEWARLHADEMVLPARIAGAIRQMLGGPGPSPVADGGGPAVAIGNVNLYDGVDVDLLMRRVEFEIAGGRL
jgi:hypothetical protein